jgi:hypothetical protein
MITARAAWAALTRVPGEVWVGAVLLGGVWATIAGVYAYGDTRYAAGRAAVLDSMVHVLDDSLHDERQRHDAALAAAKGRTDTLVQLVRGRTDTLWRTITALPPAVQTQPAVQALTAQCTALAEDCERMRAAFSAERARADSLRTVLTVQTDALAAQVLAQRDTLTTLAKRPRWRTVLGAVGGAVALGFGVGVRR